MNQVNQNAARRNFPVVCRVLTEVEDSRVLPSRQSNSDRAKDKLRNAAFLAEEKRATLLSTNHTIRRTPYFIHHRLAVVDIWETRLYRVHHGRNMAQACVS